MMNGNLGKDWENLNEELQDACRYADSEVFPSMRSFLKRKCNVQRKPGNVGLDAFILTYDDIRWIIIDKAALALYS